MGCAHRMAGEDSTATEESIAIVKSPLPQWESQLSTGGSPSHQGVQNARADPQWECTRNIHRSKHCSLMKQVGYIQTLGHCCPFISSQCIKRFVSCMLLDHTIWNISVIENSSTSCSKAIVCKISVQTCFVVMLLSRVAKALEENESLKHQVGSRSG